MLASWYGGAIERRNPSTVHHAVSSAFTPSSQSCRDRGQSFNRSRDLHDITSARLHDTTPPRLSPPPQHTAEKQRERKSRKSRRGAKGGEAGDDGGDSGGKKILVVELGASARVSSYVDLSNPSEVEMN